MKPLAIKDPFLFGEWYNIWWFHSCYADGLMNTIRQRLGYGLSQMVIEFTAGRQSHYFSRREWSDIGERYLREVIGNPNLLKDLLRDIRVAADKLAQFSESLRALKVSALTREEVVNYLERFHGYHHRVWALGQVPNVLELESSWLTDYLKDWLKAQTSLSAESQRAAFQTLVTPRELSMAQKEERAVLGLTTLPNDASALTAHWQHYKWLQFGWTGPSLTLEYFVEVVAGLKREGSAVEKLNNLHRQDDALGQAKDDWPRKLKMPEQIRTLFRLLEEILFIKAHRMDSLYMSYDAVWPLLKRIVQDNYLSVKQVLALPLTQLIDALNRKNFSPDALNEIIEYSVRYYDGASEYLLVGKEARAFLAPLKAKLPPVKDVFEFKGQCAFPGVVRGRVCIVNLPKEMDKFCDGDILVSNATDPSLLPVMKRAAGFVTNLGGLTCHAAIVARELQKPCVVGAKAAAYILHDGDQVEVDAGSGIVRKL